MNIQPFSNEHSQVFIYGIDENGSAFGGKRTYTAEVDLEKSTVDDLFQEISYRTGIHMELLKYQFCFLTSVGQLLIPCKTLASQRVTKEATLQLSRCVGLVENNECGICLEEVNSTALRLLFCQQSLPDNVVQIQTHPKAFHVKCLEQLKKDEGIKCPLCRGEVSGVSMVIP